MEWALPIILIVAGLILIIKGGDFFVDAASWIAEVSGIPPIIVGATVVSIATTMPELLVSVIAAAEGGNAMAIGNAIGSVTANTGLIMGISLAFAPFVFSRKDYLLKGILLLSSVTLLFLLSLGGVLNIWLSLLLLIPLALFIYDNIKCAKQGMVKVDENDIADLNLPSANVNKDRKTIIINIIKFILGVGGIVGGAQLLVTYGTELAVMCNISPAIIAVTLLAVGTSLPELVTTIAALIKKKSDLSIGNIIGANIIDITLILPLCALISGSSLTIDHMTLLLDFGFCLGLTFVAILPSLITKKFSRWQGLTLLVGYIAYIALRVILV